MNTFRKLLSLSLLITLVFFSACDKDDDDNPSTPTQTDPYQSGTYITNEGTFGGANGSLSFYDSKKDKLINNVFQTVNERSLGDVVQSISIAGDYAYIQVNASNTIEVVKKTTCKNIATIENIEGVRYFAAINNTTAYATQWGNGGNVAVIDLETNQVTATIAAGSGPEQIAVSGDYAYVANSGGWGSDSTVTIINTTNNSVVNHLKVGDNPASIKTDAHGDIWVLCRGLIIYDANWNIIDNTPSRIIKIDGQNQSIIRDVIISETQHPNWLDISPDGSTLYYGGGYGFTGIFAIPADQETAPTEALIDENCYGFCVNPTNNNLFVMVAPNFTENGIVKRYTADGQLLGEYEAGIAPNGAGFKHQKN